jgi:surfeit locus 1 family protein
MKYKRIPLIAYCCLLPILLALGIWQLNRAEEKRVMIKLQDQRQSTEIITIRAAMPGDTGALLYNPVKAFGHYDSNHQYLLDNQVYNGRAGYFVLTPFLLKGENKAVLVNRGWLPLGKNRSDLPAIDVDSSEIALRGGINRFPSLGIRLAGAEIPTDTWPALVQVIDSSVLAKQLGYPLFDFQVELDKNDAHGFTRDWHEPMVMTPEKHTGYAVQWFLLAITLTVLFIKYGFKK